MLLNVCLYFSAPKKYKLSESGCDPQNDEHRKNNFEDDKSILTECKMTIKLQLM